MASLHIITSISFREYLWLMLRLAYRKPLMIVIVSVGLLMLSWIILSGLDIGDLPEVSFFQYTTASVILVAQPLVIIYIVRKNYQSSPTFHERLEITLDDEKIHLQGKSFYTELTWKKAFAIREIKGWFLIYQNNLSAIIIPERALRSKKAVEEFRSFLQEIPRIGLKKKPA